MLGIIAFPAVYLCIIYGQNSLITAALAMLAIHCLNRHQILAGLLAGLLATKPQLAVLFPLAFLAGSYWRAFTAAAATQLMLIICSLHYLGPATWRAFLGSASQPRIWLESGMLSWEKMISVFAFCRILGADTTLAYVLHGLVALGFIAAMLHVWRRSNDMHLRGSSLILATLATSPYVQEYEQVWLAIPLLLLTREGVLRGWLPWQREALLLGWLTPLFNWMLTAPEGQQASPVTLIVELALLAVTLRAMRRPLATMTMT